MVLIKREPDTVLPKGEPNRKILIAVDFGTTFSGLAWAQTGLPEVQIPVIQWPDAISGGLEGITNDKVPSEIVYKGQDYKWGYQINDMEPRHQWFKLELDPTQRRGSSQLAAMFPGPAASLVDSSVPATMLVRDYLSALRKHAEQVLRYKLPHSALASTPIEYIITVPAVWSDVAQAKTRACAEQAGMGNGSKLHIVSEPEAAAVYALHIMDPHNILVGDTFVLVDAGGGTVDLISYTVSELKPTLKITEATTGTGSLCGSSFLNRIFQRFLEDKLGHVFGYDEEVLDEATKRFETVVRLRTQISVTEDDRLQRMVLKVKKQFLGVAGEVFSIPVPGLRDNDSLGVRRAKYTMNGADVREIFEPVVTEIVGLIHGQINRVTTLGKSVKAVLMVGGFGQNAYLRERIRRELAGKGVEVMQSPNGWTAVVRGALMKGLASTSPSFATVAISGRCARKHYGIIARKIFVPGVDDYDRRYWAEFEGKYMIEAVNWIIKKGDTVTEDTPVRIAFYLIRKVSDGPFKSAKVEITACSDPQNVGAPTSKDSDGVSVLVKIDADLTRIPTHLIPQTMGADGFSYYRFLFDIEVTFYSAYTKYDLIYQNINYGSVAAEYV